MSGNHKSRPNPLLTFVTRHRRITMALYAMIMTAGCVLLYSSLREMEDQRIRHDFVTECQRVTSRLCETLDLDYEIVESIASFHAGNPGFSSEQFSSFVERAIDEYPNIQSLAWIPEVSAPERQHVTRDEIGNQPTGSDDQADASAALYVEPARKQQSLTRTSLNASPGRKAALDLAAKSGLPVAIAEKQLVPGKPDQSAYLLFVPVFETSASASASASGMATATASAPTRQQWLCGFAVGVFRINDILNDGLGQTDSPPFHLRMTDSDGAVLYPATEISNTSEQFTANDLHKMSVGYTRTSRCEFGGQSWNLTFSGNETWLNAQQESLGLTVFIGGIILGILLGVLLYTITERTAYVEELVCHRTLELEEANKLIREQRDRLESGQAILEASNQQLKEFAYAASHDLQTPLRGMANYAQFLKDDYSHTLDEEGNQYLDGILNSADRMQLLISELLEYSRVESQEDSMQLTDLNMIVDDVLLLLQSEVKSANAAVTSDVLPTVVCDSKQMATLYRNLLSNALKYRSDMPLRVHLSSTNTDGLQLNVQDNGIGIAKKFQSKIFDIFRRLHSQSEYPGTGIGLALCRRIAQRHGGTISVHSKVGEGSRFTFTIPPHTENTRPPFHFPLSALTKTDSHPPSELPLQQADLNCQLLDAHS